MVRPHPALILVEAHVQDPMQTVLNPPMAADGTGVRLRLRRPAADIVAQLLRLLRADFMPLAVYHRDRPQVLPQRLIADPFRTQQGVDRMLLVPAMAAIAFLVVAVFHPREI